MVPGDGQIIMNGNDDNLRRLIDMGCWTPLQTVGTDDESDVDYSSVGMNEYLAHEDILNGENVAEENIGIIIASGTIQSGSQPPGAIGSDSTAGLLRQARDDESVKARMPASPW